MSLSTALRALLDDLDAAAIQHMVVGALALDALGVPRTTFDVDVQIDLPRPPAPTASAFLGRFIEERTRDPVFDQDVLIVHSFVDPVPIELFITTHWYTRQALARARSLDSKVVGRAMRIPTAEDLILLKACFWVAPTRSRRKAAQDGVDIEAIVDDHRKTMDLGYVEANARNLGVWDALRSVL